jgi:hypothetical protein
MAEAGMETTDTAPPDTATKTEAPGAMIADAPSPLFRFNDALPQPYLFPSSTLNKEKISSARADGETTITMQHPYRYLNAPLPLPLLPRNLALLFRLQQEPRRPRFRHDVLLRPRSASKWKRSVVNEKKLRDKLVKKKRPVVPRPFAGKPRA